VLRAARFVATLEFDLDPATEAAIPGAIETFRKVSAERIRDEWAKMLAKAARPSRGFEVMARTGILAAVAPAIAALAPDAFARAMRRTDAAPRSIPLRVAALLVEASGDHDALMRALRFSNDERETALALARNARIDGSEGWTDADVRRFLQRATRARVADVLELARCDRLARGDGTAPVDTLRARAQAQLDAGVPLTAGDLAIGGQDVMQALASGPGPKIGRALAMLLDRAIEDPSLNTRERLLALVPQLPEAS
jgi:tRNA nucleotidyltransferase (CCA-adding enzyme)